MAELASKETKDNIPGARFVNTLKILYAAEGMFCKFSYQTGAIDWIQRTSLVSNGMNMYRVSGIKDVCTWRQSFVLELFTSGDGDGVAFSICDARHGKRVSRSNQLFAKQKNQRDPSSFSINNPFTKEQ